MRAGFISVRDFPKPKLNSTIELVTLFMKRVTVFNRGGGTSLLQWRLYRMSNPGDLGAQIFTGVNGSVGAVAGLGTLSSGAFSGISQDTASTNFFPVASGMAEGRDATLMNMDPSAFLTKLPVTASRQSSGDDLGDAGPSQVFVLEIKRLDSSGAVHAWADMAWMEDIP